VRAREIINLGSPGKTPLPFLRGIRTPCFARARKLRIAHSNVGRFAPELKGLLEARPSPKQEAHFWQGTPARLYAIRRRACRAGARPSLLAARLPPGQEIPCRGLQHCERCPGIRHSRSP
jgi:hypothetical protein